jgi:hypothetical protein
MCLPALAAAAAAAAATATGLCKHANSLTLMMVLMMMMIMCPYFVSWVPRLLLACAWIRSLPFFFGLGGLFLNGERQFGLERADKQLSLRRLIGGLRGTSHHCINRPFDLSADLTCSALQSIYYFCSPSCLVPYTSSLALHEFDTIWILHLFLARLFYQETQPPRIRPPDHLTRIARPNDFGGQHNSAT